MCYASFRMSGNVSGWLFLLCLKHLTEEKVNSFLAKILYS
jgi:hypothetical protein